MEEMALIRKELKAIGININQQTKFFHMSKSVYVMEMLTTLFRAKLTTGLADFGLQQML
jgi:hypothetical protein